MKQVGWHPQDIIAAVRKREGWSLMRLARENGFHRLTLHKALTLRFARAHQVIADFLGVPRHEIWPQFYDAQDRPRRPRQSRAAIKARAA